MNWRRIFNKRSVIILMCCLVMIAPNVHADGEQTSQTDSSLSGTTVNDLRTVSLGSSGTIRLKEVMLFPTQAGNQFLLTMDVYNDRTTSLNFNYYWVRVKTQQGNSYDVRMKDTSTNINPKSTKEFTFSTIVDDSVQLKDIIIEIIEFDFSVTDYQKVLDTIHIPDDYQQVVAWDKGKQLKLGTSELLVRGNLFYSSENNTNHEVSINLTVENQGKFSITVPSYNYYLQTNNGLVYPLELMTEEISVMPGAKQNIILRGKIPTSNEATGWKLAALESSEGSNQELPVFIMQLPDGSEWEAGSLDEIDYQSDNGIYTIKLEKAQQLPSESQDVISVKISVSNQHNKDPIRVPTLTAEMEFEGIQPNEEEIEGLLLEQVLNIKKDEKIHYVFNTSVPYTYDFENIRINLFEVDGDSRQSAGSLKFTTDQFVMPFITGAANIGLRGSQTEVSLLHKETYENDHYRLVNAEVILKNKEKRAVMQNQLVGTFLINEEIYFPANIPENTVMVSPSSRILVPVTAMVSKDIEIETIDLILGTKYDDSPLYQDGFMLFLPLDRPESIQGFENIRVSNFVLDMDRMVAMIDNGQLTFKFDYKLQEEYFQTNLSEHKLVIELKNEKYTISEEFVLGEDIKVTDNHFEFSVPINQDDFLRNLVGYKLTVYDSYEGFKKVKATRTFRNWDVR